MVLLENVPVTWEQGIHPALSSLCSISIAFPLELTEAFLLLWETLDIHNQYSRLLKIALNVTVERCDTAAGGRKGIFLWNYIN